MGHSMEPWMTKQVPVLVLVEGQGHQSGTTAGISRPAVPWCIPQGRKMSTLVANEGSVYDDAFEYIGNMLTLL